MLVFNSHSQNINFQSRILFESFNYKPILEERMKYEVHIGLNIHVKDGTNGNPEKLDAFDEEVNNE